jgi:hypothetical protein
MGALALGSTIRMEARVVTRSSRSSSADAALGLGCAVAVGAGRRGPWEAVPERLVRLIFFFVVKINLKRGLVSYTIDVNNNERGGPFEADGHRRAASERPVAGRRTSSDGRPTARTARWPH